MPTGTQDTQSACLYVVYAWDNHYQSCKDVEKWQRGDRNSRVSSSRHCYLSRFCTCMYRTCVTRARNKRLSGGRGEKVGKSGLLVTKNIWGIYTECPVGYNNHMVACVLSCQPEQNLEYRNRKEWEMSASHGAVKNRMRNESHNKTKLIVALLNPCLRAWCPGMTWDVDLYLGCSIDGMQLRAPTSVEHTKIQSSTLTF